MSVVKSSILLMTLLGAGTLQAANYMTFMGGGGEPEGNDTIFDLQVESMGKFDANANWETQVSFNGGHSETESLLEKGFRKKGISNTPFTESSYNKMIEDYEAKIESGTIKSGDQLLLVISTHGAKKKTDEEKTHEISVKGGSIQNYDTGEGSRVVSLDKLQKLAELAEAKGIKLGIVDLSCHSGNTLALQNKSTCVVSGTGPNHYGYAGKGSTTYTNAFISSMKKGKSLEQAFLDARSQFTDLSFPMISTPTGEKLNDVLYDPLTPYLYSYDPKHDKFSEYLKAQAEKGDACQMPQEKDALLKLINQFQIIKKYGKAEYYSDDGRKFQDTVKAYYDYLDKMRADYAKLKGPDKKAPKEKIETTITDGGMSSKASWEYTQEEILAYNVETMKQLYEKRLREDTGIGSIASQAALANVLKIEARQKELIRLTPDFAKKKEYFKNIPELEKQSYNLALKVASRAKDFYQAYYLNSAASDKAPNPCKDFIL